MNMKSTCAALALTVGLGVAANAAIIVPITATSTGTSTQNGDAGTALVNLVNGSGLSGTPIDDQGNAGGITHGTDLSQLWVTANNGSDFFEPAPGTVQIDFDLGGSYDLTDSYIWGYGYFGTSNSASAITVSYSTDGTTFSNAEDITLPSGTVTEAQSSTLNALAGATHVRFLLTDNLGSGDRVGLGEVRFGGTAAVPEPSSAALLGLGGIALILRRRK
jgi:hypothetical protein